MPCRREVLCVELFCRDSRRPIDVAPGSAGAKLLETGRGPRSDRDFLDRQRGYAF